jgi:hypothetical protein
MAGPSNADIYESLGHLKASVEGLRRDFTASEEQAREHRATVYKRFEELSLTTASVEARVEAMEPVVETFTNFRLKAGGAIFVLGIIGATMGMLATYFADGIKTFIGRVFFPH